MAEIITPDDSVDQLIASLFPRPKKGRYKVEMVTEKNQSTWKLFGGMVKVWLSGSAMSGNADESVCLCPRCKSPVPPDQLGYFDQDQDGRPCRRYYGGVCIECNLLTRSGKFLDWMVGRQPLNDWVVTLMNYYRTLRGDVDFYLKHFRHDITSATHRRMENPGFAKPIDDARLNLIEKDLVIYPLSRLIVDLHAGRSLRSTLRAFLTS